MQAFCSKSSVLHRNFIQKWQACQFKPADLRALSSAVLKEKRKPDVKRFIVDKIRATGPITVAEYMRTAVSAPSVGYYGRFSEEKQIFGDDGTSDFITSPELTQMFGELIGVWIYYELANTGYTKEWSLIENGPGTGQLMSDILAALYKFQETKVSVHLIETSLALIEKQERVLCASNSTPPAETENVPYIRKNKTKTGVPIYWYHNIDDVPEQFSVCVSNEFLDALPIHQFEKKRTGKWHETYVNVNDSNELVFMSSRGENLHTQGLLPDNVRDEEGRKYWEVCPDAGTYINQVAERITTFGGFGLMVDYGHDGSRPDLSLRAYSKHKQVNPLSRPGEIDITADVNFGYLKDLVTDRTVVYGPTSQREFLGQLGLQYRLRKLLKECSSREDQEALIKSYNYLVGDMGEKFKAMSIFPKTLSTILEKRGGPAGFATKVETPTVSNEK